MHANAHCEFCPSIHYQLPDLSQMYVTEVFHKLYCPSGPEAPTRLLSASRTMFEIIVQWDKAYNEKQQADGRGYGRKNGGHT